MILNVYVRSGFNRISKGYDFLQKLVFGNALRKAEIASISVLKNCRTVVILGGGRGFFLKHLIKLQIPSILYVEISDKMIEKAKRRLKKSKSVNSEITFYNGSWEEINYQNNIDAVVVNYFLDVFSESQIKDIIQLYSKQMNSNAMWYCTDFYLTEKSTLLSRYLIKIMYVFFGVTCNIEASYLPNIFTCFKPALFTEIVHLHSDYLRQSVYQKK